MSPETAREAPYPERVPQPEKLPDTPEMLEEEAARFLIRAKTRVDEFASRPKLHGVDLEETPEEIRAHIAALEKEAREVGAVFEDEVRKVVPLESERMMPHHQKEKLQKAKKEKPEKMGDKIIRVLDVFAEALTRRSTEDGASDRVKETAGWLPDALIRLRDQKARLADIVARTEREGKLVGAFAIDFQFAAAPQKKDVLGLEDARLEYGIEKLSELETTLGVDFKKMGEDADIGLEEIIKEEEKGDHGKKQRAASTASLPNIKSLERLRNALFRMKEIAKVVGLGVAGAAIAPLAGVLKVLGLGKKLGSSKFLQRLDAAQIPGIPGFGTLIEVPVMRRSEESLLSERPSYSGLLSSTQLFRHYDARRDAFVAEKEPRHLTRYETSVDDHTELGKATLRLEEHVDINEFTSDVELANRDPDTGFISIPRPFDESDALMMPLRVEANYQEWEGDGLKENKYIDLPLHYDGEGQLWVDPRALSPTQKKTKLIVRYGLYGTPHDQEESLLTSFTVREFMKKNPDYFAARVPHVDKEAAAMKLELPPDFEALMANLEKGDLGNAQKVNLLGEYMDAHFGYGKGFFAALRIATARGKNSVERIAHAQEGVCFDTNKLVYILLARLGVPAEMHVGYGRGEWQIERSQKAGYDVAGGEFVNRTRARAWADITTKHGHAFLRYWNADAGTMQTVDFTASDSLADIKHKEDRNAKIARVRHELDEKYDFPTDAMVREEENKLHEETIEPLMQFYQIDSEANVAKKFVIIRNAEDTGEPTIRLIPQGRKPMLMAFIKYIGKGQGADTLLYPTVTDPGLGSREEVRAFIESHIERRALIPFAELFYRESGAVMHTLIGQLEEIAEGLMRDMTRTKKRAFAEGLRPFFRDEEEKERSEFARFELRPEIIVRYLFTRYFPRLFGPAIGFDAKSGAYKLYTRDEEQGISSYAKEVSAEDIARDVRQDIKEWKDKADKIVEGILDTSTGFKDFESFEDNLWASVFRVRTVKKELSPAEVELLDALRYTWKTGVTPKDVVLKINEKGKWIFIKKRKEKEVRS